MMCGGAVGALVLPPLAQALVDALGWRRTYLALGLGVLVIGLPNVLALVRERPRRRVWPVVSHDRHAGPSRGDHVPVLAARRRPVREFDRAERRAGAPARVAERPRRGLGRRSGRAVGDGRGQPARTPDHRLVPRSVLGRLRLLRAADHGRGRRAAAGLGTLAWAGRTGGGPRSASVWAARQTSLRTCWRATSGCDRSPRCTAGHGRPTRAPAPSVRSSWAAPSMHRDPTTGLPVVDGGASARDGLSRTSGLLDAGPPASARYAQHAIGRRKSGCAGNIAATWFDNDRRCPGMACPKCWNVERSCAPSVVSVLALERRSSPAGCRSE